MAEEIAKMNTRNRPNENRPTPEALRAYRYLVEEICFGERAQYREANKTRAEIEAILAAAGKEPSDLANDCDDVRRRWR